MPVELATQSGPIKWGFPKPTVIIDSQSAAPLRGIEAEQVFYRMFLMGKPRDTALVNYPVDGEYLNYLKNKLQIPMPDIIQIENKGTGCLSGDILAQKTVVKHIQQLVNRGNKVQFFNLTDEEIELADQLGNPTYIQNLGKGEKLGTKNGFREFCNTNGINMPAGNICQDMDSVLKTVIELSISGVVIKSNAGTGGAELGSNVKITADEIKEKQDEGTLPAFLQSKMAALNPIEPPFVVEQFLKLPEASLHIFLDEKGDTVIEPTVFGQFAHDGSYIGGHYPNGFTHDFNKNIKTLADDKIIPALKKIGATGMHCLDFLYDEQSNEFYFIEDNTRPGALDFISQFVNKVASTHNLEKPAWYHYNLPIKEIAGRPVTFAEIQEVLSDLLTPSKSFLLLSNPNVLPYGYNLHLTGVSSGDESSSEKAKEIYIQAIEKLKKHYNYQNEIHIP